MLFRRVNVAAQTVHREPMPETRERLGGRGVKESNAGSRTGLQLIHVGIKALMGEIRRGTPLGRALGNGAASAGRALGVTRVPVVKGQAISAYDPRAIKGTGITYATSPQGADHTAGPTIRVKVDHLNPAVQGPVSRECTTQHARL